MTLDRILYWILDTGFWILDSGYWTLDAGRWTWIPGDAGFWTLEYLDTGWWVGGFGCWMLRVIVVYIVVNTICRYPFIITPLVLLFFFYPLFLPFTFTL